MINIVYEPYVLSSKLTGNTVDYSASSAITSGVYISSGFTFNIPQFDRNQINRLDIIDNIINYISDGNKYMLDVIIANFSGETNTVTQTGDYCIKISYENEDIVYLIMRVIYDSSNEMSVILVDNIYIPQPVINTTTTTLPVTTTTTTSIIYDISIVYMPVLSSNLTGDTINYSGASSAITSGVYISSGFTFNLNGFDNNQIDRLDIINNVISYVNNGNKYSLNILIVDSGETNTVTQTGDYCVKISYNNVIEYLMMKVIYDISSDVSVILIEPTLDIISSGVEVPIINIRQPIIYYNNPTSGTSWMGSETTVPYDVFLDFIHNGITGWTLDSLKTLFISGVTDCIFGDISLSNIIFILYKSGSVIPLTGITESGVYNIYISVTDSAGNTIINIISNIKVDDSPPVIVYKPNVIMNITGNTINYSGASSAITSGVYISSGFTFNLNGFDNNQIYRLDIIENIVNYVYDNIDIDINKYMLNVLLASKHTDNVPIVYNLVTLPGLYCVKFSISDSSGNEIINYFIMTVVYDVSTYSEGYWQDNKVWIDSTLWIDHPIIS